MAFSTKLTSERFDRQLVQFASFGGALVVFVCAVLALSRFAATPSEFITGLMATAAASFGMIVMGIVSGPQRTTS